jgi:hypothetical protein
MERFRGNRHCGPAISVVSVNESPWAHYFAQALAVVYSRALAGLDARSCA